MKNAALKEISFGAVRGFAAGAGGASIYEGLIDEAWGAVRVRDGCS